MWLGVCGNHWTTRILVVLTCLAIGLQFGGSVTTVRLLAASTQESDDDSQREEDQTETELFSSQRVSSRLPQARDMRLVCVIPAHGLRQHRSGAYDRFFSAPAAEHDLRNGIGSPLVC
jgi:hypothetical protein